MPKNRKGTLLLWNGFAFHVRGFACVQNQVLSTYGNSAYSHSASAQKVDHSYEADKKLVTVIRSKTEVFAFGH